MQVTSVSPQQLAEDLLALWSRVATAAGSARTYALIDELGLSLTQLKLLEALAAHAEEPTLKEVGTQLALSLPATSRTVEGLLRRGLLERREDEHDRRMKRLTLTDPGRAVLARLHHARLSGLEEFAAGVPAPLRDHLGAALKAVLDR